MVNHWILNHPQWTSEFSYLTVDSRLVSEIVLRRVVMEAKCLCFNCHTQTICSKLPLLLQMRNASSRDHPLAGYFPPCSDCIESKATTHHARRLCTCVGLNAENDISSARSIAYAQSLLCRTNLGLVIASDLALRSLPLLTRLLQHVRSFAPTILGVRHMRDSSCSHIFSELLTLLVRHVGGGRASPPIDQAFDLKLQTLHSILE